MAATYHLKILTPATIVFDGEVEAIVAPGEAGYLGVLANHAPIITTLRPGHLKVSDASGVKWYAIKEGILRVAKNEAILLSEAAEETSAPQSS